MENKDILNKLAEIFLVILEVDITEDSSMSNVSKWDSLNHIRIMFAIEEQFEKRFESEDLTKLTSVSKIIEKLKE